MASEADLNERQPRASQQRSLNKRQQGVLRRLVEWDEGEWPLERPRLCPSHAQVA
jgi:hypothetical protein